MIRMAARELSGDWRNFKGWIQARKGQLLFVCLYALFVMGPRLFYHDVGIDTGLLFKDYGHYNSTWAGEGRFGLAFSKWLFRFTQMVPYAANVLMLAGLLVFVTVFAWLVREWGGENHGSRWFYPVFSVLFLSAPIITEQFYFTLQAPEFAWAMLLCLFGVYLAGKVIYGLPAAETEKPRGCGLLWGAGAVVCMVWAFGTYQAFFVFYIVLAVISYLLACRANVRGQSGKYWFFNGTGMAGLFLTGAAGWLLTDRVLCRYFFPASDYISGMLLWNTAPRQVWTVLKLQFSQIYLPKSVNLYYTVLFTPVMLLTACFVLLSAVRKRSRTFPCLLIAMAVYALSPALLVLISGGGNPVRSMFFYPLILAFSMAWLIDCCVWKLPRVLLLLLFVSCGWNQTVNSLQMQENIHLVYEGDRLLLNRILTRMEEKAGTRLKQIPAAFVGKLAPDAPNPMGETGGHSFLSWDSERNVSLRVEELAHVMGVDLTIADEEQFAEACEYSEQMPPWPAEGSIRVHDGVLIVKLSSLEKTNPRWFYSGGWHHWDDKPLYNDLLRDQWYEENGIWYYFDGEGDMVTGTRIIDGKEYRFDPDGKWIEEP